MHDFNKINILLGEIQNINNRIVANIAKHFTQEDVISLETKMVLNDAMESNAVIESFKKSLVVPEQNYQAVQTKTNIRKKFEDDGSKEASLKLAYALSRFDANILNNTFGINLNQNEALDMISGILNINKGTFRNYRDYFDRYVPQVYSNRKGWNAPLPPQHQIIKDILDDKSEVEMMEEVRHVLESLADDIDLLVNVSFGFLFGKKGVRTKFPFTYEGQSFEIVNAPHEDRVAYMLFTGFGNSLTSGIYPGIYVYRKFNKIFTVFGESVSTPPKTKWAINNAEYKTINEGFDDNSLTIINRYPNTYLSNRYYESYDFNSDMSPVDKISLSQKIVKDIKQILDRYIEQFQQGGK